MNTPRDRQNVEAVLQVSVKANDELYREKEGCEYVRCVERTDEG